MSTTEESRPNPAAPPGFDRLAAEIRAQRKYGRVIVNMVEQAGTEGRSPTAVADRLAGSLALTQLGAGWRPVSKTEARRIARDILQSDLAYHTEIMSASQAETLVDRFLAFFGDPLTFLTNTHPLGSARTVAPITEATFDEGIVVVAEDRAGILWVADED
jgi:hypothetical protein